jgi:hypothetical protein
LWSSGLGFFEGAGISVDWDYLRSGMMLGISAEVGHLPLMTLAERYREQAKWAHAQVEKAKTPELRQQWLDLVQQYELLAVKHARKNRHHPSAGMLLTMVSRSRPVPVVPRSERSLPTRLLFDS